eukprot:1142565-Pelagomonas_calceolata.AAC.2
MQLTHVHVPPVQAYTTQKIDRESQSKEFVRVTLMPSWEPEEFEEIWPKFRQRLIEIETRQNEPDLSRPTADSALSNLERQGFEKPDALTLGSRNLT